MENESGISLGGLSFYILKRLYEIKMFGGGGKDGVRNICRLEINSIVWKRHKETPEQANGDYFIYLVFPHTS